MSSARKAESYMILNDALSLGKPRLLANYQVNQVAS